jgi:CoA:oxalate CoA-transferase
MTLRFWMRLLITESWFSQRDKIKEILYQHLKTKTSKHWLDILEPADIWYAAVLDIDALTQKKAFKTLEMLQKVKMSDGFTYETTRCPITFNSTILTHQKGSPRLVNILWQLRQSLSFRI